jgi:TPP-dependent pyruvate/acetoin dehydrogenase alpha subunit
MMDVAMRVPDLATNDSVVTVIRWLVEVGQPVRRGQPLVEVQTDKSAVVVESVVTGTLRSVSVREGEETTAGEVIAVFDAEEGPAVADNGPVAVSTMVQRVSAAVPPAPAGSTRVSFFEANRRARALREEPAAPVHQSGRYDRDFLLGLYERMVLIREFEEGVKFLFLEGAMPGTIHQCQGQEATAVGVCAALGAEDFITSTFRGHGHALARGLTPESLLFELFGASTGCCRGKGGSMHVGDMDLGMVPGIAIVGGGIPLAAGMALAMKMQRRPGVVACFFGDGAVAEGAFHEGVNLAAIWDVPAIFVCENNLYGASTHVGRVMRNPRISDRAAAYGIRGETVDGNDVLAVYEAARTAAEECRDGRGPVLLELLTYRRTGHSRRDACHYQPAEEREAWSRRDPIDRFGGLLLEWGLADRPALDQIRARVEARFQEAVAEARRQPLPSADDLTTDVFA